MKYIKWFKEISIKDVPLVGGKNASLGEMYCNLTKKGINIPNGFAITSKAYFDFLKQGKIYHEIKKILESYNLKNVKELQKAGKLIRDLILKTPLPKKLEKEILDAYQKLSEEYEQNNVDVAVRSSATAEDLPSIAEDEPVLIKVNGQFYYDNISKIYKQFGENRNLNIEVPAMKNNKILWAKIESIYKHRAKHQKIFQIETETGKKIKTAPNHSLIVLDPDTLSPKTIKIEELTYKHLIPTIKVFPRENQLQSNRMINVLDYIKGNDIIQEKGIIKIKNKSNNWRIQRGLPNQISLNEDAAYFFGLFAAEGSVYKNNTVILTNSNEKIINRLRKFLKSLGLPFNQKINKNSLRIYNKSLVRLVKAVAGKPIEIIKGKGKSCRIKEVPNFIYGSNYKIIGQFLRGCFDGDGYVSRENISYSSRSKKLIGGIIQLLEMLGIQFYYREKQKGDIQYEILIPIFECEKFKEKIGFSHSLKEKKLEQLIKDFRLRKLKPQFKSALFISEEFAKTLREKILADLSKKEIEINFCPICHRKISKSSPYKGRQRYYCKWCNKTFHSEEIQREKRVIYQNYNEKGQFIKKSIPWNKGLIKGRFTIPEFKKIIRKYNLPSSLFSIFDSNVKWEQVKKITPITYSKNVYDFVVPRIENFAAGIGGIITHNSASFAGQHETYLNVSGAENLLKAVKKSYSSLFLDRAITYRIEKGFDHLKIAISTGVQKMIRSDLDSSGVIFTLDTETGFKDVIVINGIYGLGELIVKGKITPDEFLVFKPTLLKGYKAIIRKDLGNKTIKYIYNQKGGIKNAKVSKRDQLKFSLTDEDILTLAKWALIIEDHYSQKNKKWTPQDIEWAKDGKTKKLFIVQSRPETIHSIKDADVYKEYQIQTNKKPILSGIAIGDKVGYGKVRVIESLKELSNLQKGEVLVTEMTDPDWTSAMPLASAIVTDKGGKTCFDGDTLLLTNKGFLTIKEIVERIPEEKLFTLSLNRDNLQTEWQPILNGFVRKSEVCTINISQTGRMKNNILKVTPDHKFLTFRDRNLISEEIKKIINNRRGILSTFLIPPFNKKNTPETTSLSVKEAYLFGSIFTDGNLYLNNRHGCVSFIQNPAPSKIKFIEQIKKYFQDVYHYQFHLVTKPPSEGIIRGKKICGKPSLVLKAYKKEIVQEILNKKNRLENCLLQADQQILYAFLAGVVDGDGSYNSKSNRINIYCSKGDLFKFIIIALLRLGINYQATVNRNIYNIQIVDHINELFSWTQRVKGEFQRINMGVQLFFARQLLEDIKYQVNYKGRILSYVYNNLLIDAEKIKDNCIPLIAGSKANHELTKIINSSLKMYRVDLSPGEKEQLVYNIEVKKNHNYIVFTNKLTPIIVENCHAAIISRELGIPCIVGTKKATSILKTGNEITVDCTSGAEGRIFLGKIPFKKKTYELKKIPNLKTKISINIGAPDIAFQTSLIPNDGVGLAREEFIIAEKIKIHPLALYYYEKIKNGSINVIPSVSEGPLNLSQKKLKQILNQIDRLTIEHQDKKEYFIKELAEGIAQIAAAFYPKEVIVRFSDFKTNEYRQLVGGELFEPQEENPMLGWRGASRYYDKDFKPAFEMECLAMKRAIEEFGLINISVMVPFCRTLEEGKKVKEIIQKYLPKTKIYVMAEIPSNALLINEFLDIFDGVSIGSNDLSQLVLGIDRDNAELAKIGNENNEAVKKMIKDIISACKERGKYVGICGQAPSDYPEFAEFLVKEGISAISLNPDTVIKTILHLSKHQK